MNSYDLCKSLAFSSLYNVNKTRSVDISNNQDKNVSICHLSIDLHIQPIIPYYLDMYFVLFTFLLKTADFILDRVKSLRLCFDPRDCHTYHNSKVATVSPG